MTTAPPNLLAIRQLLAAHLPLSGTAVGIVGDPAHRGGYHCGRDRLDLDDYSVHESSRDHAGLCGYASALDIGWWAAHDHDLRHMSAWLVAQCRAGTADTADIREIIYSLDGRTVHRWDRLGRRTSGDSSHLWHTHVSYFRDATKANRDLRPLYTRYLTEIGVISMIDQPRDVWMGAAADVIPLWGARATRDNPTAQAGWVLSRAGECAETALAEIRQARGELAALAATVAGRDPLTVDEVVQGVLAGLGVRPAAEVAAALVAAGQDPVALAAALAALAEPTP